jgi:Secretion system C-terminal sorting domain/PKD domain
MKTKLYSFFSAILLLAVAKLGAQQCTVTYTYTSSGLTINATATGAGALGFPVYGWDWGDTQITAAQQTASHTFAAPGTYNVCAIYIDLLDTANCQATSCQQVTVTATGVSEPQQLIVNVATNPNPFLDKTTFSVNMNKSENVNIEVFDMIGNKVANVVDNEQMGAGTHTIQWSPENLAAGVYFVRVQTGDQVTVQRIVKQ